MTTLREAAQQALEALEGGADSWQRVGPAIDALKAALAEPVQQPVWVCPDSAEHRYQKPGHCEDCGKTLVQEPVQFEPQEAVTEDGWCEWVCPKPVGYLMQCCGCGLIHEVDSRVAKYQPRPSEEFEVVDDPDLQVQWRMKRRDDISPKRKPLTENEIAPPPEAQTEAEKIAYCAGWWDALAKARGSEPVAWRWGYRSITTGEMDWRGYVEIAAHPNLRSPAIIMQPLYTAPFPLEAERNFCPRCGKRTNDIHTCTPPDDPA